MQIQDVKTLKNLLDFIVGEYPNLNKKEIAKLSGISWGSFAAIDRGEIVGDNVARKLNGFLKEKFGYEFKQMQGNNIQIIQTKNFIVKGDYAGQDSSINKSLPETEKIRELEVIIIELNKEILELKRKMKSNGQDNKSG